MGASLRDFRLLAGAALCAMTLSACSTNPFSHPEPQAAMAPPPAVPEIPASIRAEEIVGRWGYGAYHNDADRVRTETAARGQCGQPVIINRGPNGGVMMYLADSAQLQELSLKGSPSGKNYIGPPGPAGGPQDREIVDFRRPQHCDAVDESRSRQPLWHGSLCALRSRRQRPLKAGASGPLTRSNHADLTSRSANIEIDVALRDMAAIVGEPRAMHRGRAVAGKFVKRAEDLLVDTIK